MFIFSHHKLRIYNWLIVYYKFCSSSDNWTFETSKNFKSLKSPANKIFLFFILASLPFLSSGLVFGYLLFLPAIDAPLYSKWTSWPYLALIGSIVLTAAFLTFPKFVHGKYTFQQFYCLALSTVFYLTSGLLFALTKGELDKLNYNYGHQL